MKAQKKILVALLIIGFQALLAACANTAHGISADAHNAEDKVESATH